MSDNFVPSSLDIQTVSLATLAVEWWRLSEALPNASGPVRHALRKIEDFLRQYEIEVNSLNGKPFDVGMAATVVDVVKDASLPRGRAVVEQTVSPMVMWRGKVIRTAEVVIRQG